jgi:AcrR family transcriptional regulator
MTWTPSCINSVLPGLRPVTRSSDLAFRGTTPESTRDTDRIVSERYGVADDDITRRRSERAHTAILEATVALLREDGYPNLRLDAVAARARVGKTTIYRWWPGKALLAIEALQTLVDPPHVTFSGDSRTDVRALVARVAEVWAEPVGDTLLALAADTARDPEARARLVELLAPRRAADTAVLLSAAARGDLPHDVDVPLLLDVVFGTLLFRRMRGAPVDDVVDELADLVVAGRRPRVTPAP